MILEKNVEEQQWNLYCAISANALADDIGSFDEFRNKLNHPTNAVPTVEQTEPTLNRSQMDLQVEKANKLLSGFIPPMKGGG